MVGIARAAGDTNHQLIFDRPLEAGADWLRGILMVNVVPLPGSD
jgi:hypothetical protein